MRITHLQVVCSKYSMAVSVVGAGIEDSWRQMVEFQGELLEVNPDAEKVARLANWFVERGYRVYIYPWVYIYPGPRRAWALLKLFFRFMSFLSRFNRVANKKINVLKMPITSPEAQYII